MTETPNNALDPTAVSVSDFLLLDFIEFLSFLDLAVPAVGQLFRYTDPAHGIGDH